MIKINLLPTELRMRKKIRLNIPYIPLIVLGVVLFLAITVILYIDFLATKSQYQKVQAEWQRLSPQMGQLRTLQSKVEVELKGEKDFLEKYMLSEAPMTQVLSWVSEFLPERGWLTEVKIQNEGDARQLVLQGIALPVRTKTSIEQIEEYLQKLKSKLPESRLNLTTARQVSDEVEGTSFVATFDWGGKKTA